MGRARVEFDGTVIADSRQALRVLETSHPPVIYFPAADVRQECLRVANGSSVCEFKGRATYWDIVSRDRYAESAAWSYPDPLRGYRMLKDYVAFYPARVDACYIEKERVQAQAGDFYGGWITAGIVGPFKGGPGTAGW
ncbi:MAG: DUF427 domain-containing protein [Candidatus Dormibacter sp.]